MSTNITIRIDKDVKAKSEKIFAELGLNMSSAINIFLKKAIRDGGIPFSMTLDTPNAETLQAMSEIEDMISGKIPAKIYTSTDELFEELNS